MERKDEQPPGKEQPAMPQTDEERESVAQPRERDQRKPEEQADETVGPVPDPQDEKREGERDKT